jgi:hypothetical protein
MGVVIISLMHYQWGYLRPLLLQSILGFRTLAAAPVVQVWLFGQKAEGKLTRPWTAPNPFGYLSFDISQILTRLFSTNLIYSAPPEAATSKDVKKQEKKEEKKKVPFVFWVFVSI